MTIAGGRKKKVNESIMHKYKTPAINNETISTERKTKTRKFTYPLINITHPSVT